MSWANARIVAAVIACLAAGLLTGRAWAGDPDPLKDAEARQKVAADKAEQDARDTRDEAIKLARTNPTLAIKRLQDRLQLLDLQDSLSADRKAALTALLKKALADIQRTADAAASADANPGFRPVAPDPRDADQKKLINEAISRITSSKDALAESEEIRHKKANGIAALYKDVDTSSIPAGGEYVFPPREKWIELSQYRLKKTMLSETERTILKALAATMSVDLTDQKFGGMIDWFQKQMKVTIVVDKGAMQDVGASDESTLVSLHLNKVTTRTALKKMLADVGLTYYIKNETLFVTTPAKAKDDMITRSYYVGDLVGAYDMRFGPYLSQYQALAQMAQLVQMITNNIDKDSWEVNGKEGGGTIVFDPVHMALIVKQSAEVHFKMLQGFNF